MTELLEAVRRPPLASADACGGFDFQLRKKIGGRQYRPAFLQTRQYPHDPPVLLRHRRRPTGWIQRGRSTQFSLPGRTVIVTGDTWEMHFMDAALAQKVATELQGRIVDQ
jgi:hypothetical protein